MILVIMFLSILPSSLLLFNIFYIYNMDPMVYNILAQLVLFVPVVLIGVKMSGERFKSALSLNKTSITDVLLAVGLAIAIGPLTSLLSMIMLMFYPNNVPASLGVAYESPLLLSILAICVIPAVFEELIFRGIIFTGFKNVKLSKACVMGGLIFAIAHFDAQQILYTFIIGVLFCYIVYRTKSIIPGMVTHFMVNFTSLMSSRIEFAQTAETVAEEIPLDLAISQLMGPYLLLTLFSLPIIYYIVSLMGRKYGRGKPLFNLRQPEEYEFKVEDESVLDYAPQAPYEEKLLKWQFILIILLYIPTLIFY